MEETIEATESQIKKAFDLWLIKIKHSPEAYNHVIDFSDPPPDYSEVCAKSLFGFLKEIV